MAMYKEAEYECVYGGTTSTAGGPGGSSGRGRFTTTTYPRTEHHEEEIYKAVDTAVSIYTDLLNDIVTHCVPADKQDMVNNIIKQRVDEARSIL